MKVARAACIAIVSLVIACSALLQGGCSGQVDSPEDAIAAYLAGVARADLDKVLAACAVDELSEGFDFERYSEWLGIMTLRTYSPTDTPFYSDLTRERYSSDIGMAVKMLTYTLLTLPDDEPGFSGYPYVMTEEMAEDFMDGLEIDRLTDLEVVEIETPASFSDIEPDSSYGKSLDEKARSFGADEYAERVVLLSFEHDHYALGFELLRYDSTWKILQMSGSASGLSSNWGERITVEEFETMVEGD